ncbi:MAG: prolyl oligopeptidase family serine peptidase [Bacteroidales bacterium]|nr:prolyl oligopeptidase family serine peptidase [Bacteroidales bacterium]
MKRMLLFVTLLILVSNASALSAGNPHSGLKVAYGQKTGGEYTMVVDGFDWGPGVSKVILSMGETVTSTDPGTFAVYASRHSDCVEITGEAAAGERTVITAYVSDNRGNRMESGRHVTIVLFVSPLLTLGNPFAYVRGEGACRGNVWVDYQMTIVDKTANRVWDTQAGRFSKELERFDLSGRFSSREGINMSYAFHIPETTGNKIPLIIWLHGGGEGGADPSTALLANRAANYASEEIQAIFKGAYVLVPQCPGAWMHNDKGVMTEGKEEDMYHGALMELIRAFVSSHSNIDTDRIYVGGCSNGGYMSLKLILEHPNYFAAGYISALAYQSQYISDEKINSIKNVPIWFVHSADDQTTIPDRTVIPVYNRLKAAGAKNVHFSYYDNVIDLTGLFGGAGYHFPGHWSWVYCHVNQCWKDVDGSPVEVDGKPVHIMQWLAAQRR